LQKRESLYLRKYYLSIEEMPMYNWVNIYENHNLSSVSKTGKLCKRAAIVYEKMTSQLIDEFGVSEDYLQILKNKIKIEQYYIDQIETGNKSNQIFIEILEIDNSELESKNKKTDLFDMVTMIKEGLGFEIEYIPKIVFQFLWVKVRNNPITVYEFHKYTNRIANKNKHNK